MKFLLAENNNTEGKNAGSKARIDVLKILKKNGYKHIVLYDSKSNRVSELVSIIKAFLKLWFATHNNDTVFVEHPYSPFMFCVVISRYLSIIKRKKELRTIILIHDIESIRYGIIEIDKEIEVLSRYDQVICHNQEMKQFLEDHGLNTQCDCLGFFDYLCNEKSKRRVYSSRPIVCFAGNLSKEKSGFLYKLCEIKGIDFNLYGNKVNLEASNISYKGFFSPVEIVSAIEGNYGLVWDGLDIIRNNSKGLSYLRIISPHKFSLYLAAGLPVIVWEESALAQIVREKHIGLIIRDLKELPEVLEKVDEQQYLGFVNDVADYMNRVRRGQFLSDILLKMKDN